MKRNTLYLICTISFIGLGMTTSQQQRLHEFILRGNIAGKNSGYVYLNYIPAGDMATTDSCMVNNGHFEIRGYITEPTRAQFSTFEFNRAFDENNLADFYIEPVKMNLSATINQFRSLQLKGSVSENERTALLKLEAKDRASINLSHDSLKVYNEKYQYLKGSKKDTNALHLWEHKIDSINKLIPRYNNNIYFTDSLFIAQNPNSYIAADWLSHAKSDWLSFSSFKKLYSNFSVRIQESYPGKKIKFEIEKEEKIYCGANAINFSAISNKGDSISLADYKGKKYVLLDFGASWCSPCRSINPDLAKKYEKYKTGLEIISISIRDTEKNWRAAIQKDQLQWPQILDNNINHPQTSRQGITDLYNINQIPALILIDKNSTIIGKYGAFYSSKQAYLADLNENLIKRLGY